MKIVVGITGASGAVYGKRLVQAVLRLGHHCHLVVSAAGNTVIGYELEEDCSLWPSLFPGGENLRLWSPEDLYAPFCSGSNPADGMAVIPCSMGTLGRMAAGTSDSLLTRAADVCLKERIRLVVAFREAPLNLIHLENMARLTKAGAIVLPAAPGFYHRPSDMDGLIDHVVGRTLDCLRMPHDLYAPWNEGGTDASP